MIQLPWVSRDTLDLMREDRAKMETRLDEREAHWAARYDALLLAYTEITKRQVPEPPVLKERSRDEVIEAILSKAGNNGQIRAHLSAWAMQQRRAGIPDEVIIPQILVWASDDDSQDGAV